MQNQQSSLDLSAELEASRELRESLQEIVWTQVDVQALHHGGKLDVRVDFPKLKEELEAEHPDIKISPYSDLKFTVSKSDD